MPVRLVRGKWQADISYAGKRYRSRLFETEREAQIWEAQSKANLLAGNPPVEQEQRRPTQFVTLEQAVENTINTYWVGTKAEKTARLNATAALKFFGYSRDIREITNQDIHDYVGALRSAGNTGGTINRKLAALSKVFRLAHKLRQIDYLPVLERQRESRGRDRFITKEEEQALLANILLSGYSDIHSLVVFLLDTGCRLGEALKLDWSDIEANQVVFRDTKNGDTRSVPMTTRAKEAVSRGNRQGAGPFSNINPNGRLRSAWEYARSRMGLTDDPSFVVHILRHTCASRLIQAGVPLERVQKWLGHKTIQQTLRYAHLRPSDLYDAVSVLEKFSQPGPKLAVVSSDKT